jgi:YD repeat-containing protein
MLTSMTYNSSGALTSSVTNTYDLAGNLLTSIDGDGTKTTNTWVGGELAATTVQAGTPSAPGTGAIISRTSDQYDEDGNPIQTVDGDNNVTYMTYDANGNMLTSMTYNSMPSKVHFQQKSQLVLFFAFATFRASSSLATET